MPVDVFWARNVLLRISGNRMSVDQLLNLYFEIFISSFLSQILHVVFCLSILFSCFFSQVVVSFISCKGKGGGTVFFILPFHTGINMLSLFAMLIQLFASPSLVNKNDANCMRKRPIPQIS